MSDKISFPRVPNWRDSPQAAAIHKAYDTCGFDGLTHRQVEVVLDALDVGGFLAPPAALSAPSEPAAKIAELRAELESANERIKALLGDRDKAGHLVADLVRADNNRTGSGPGGRINAGDTIPLQLLLGLSLTIRDMFEGTQVEAPAAPSEPVPDRPRVAGTAEHGWTRHGHRCCDQATGPRPSRVARCGGPAICRDCAADAAIRHTPAAPPPVDAVHTVSTDEEIDYSDSPTSEPGLLEALYPVSHAAAEERGYARAIADLRDVQRYLDWDAASRFLGHPLLTDNQMLAAIAYLESIAPGRTTP